MSECMSVGMYTSVCMHLCMYICVSVCMYAYKCMYVSLFVFLCGCFYRAIYVYSFVCVFVCAYVRMYVCMCPNNIYIASFALSRYTSGCKCCSNWSPGQDAAPGSGPQDNNGAGAGPSLPEAVLGSVRWAGLRALWSVVRGEGPRHQQLEKSVLTT